MLEVTPEEYQRFIKNDTILKSRRKDHFERIQRIITHAKEGLSRKEIISRVGCTEDMLSNALRDARKGGIL